MTCQSVKLLPKVLIPDTSSEVKEFATRFSCDIMERERQNVMVVREELSQLVMTKIVPDQTAQTMSEALISLVSPLVSDKGATVRTDGAAVFRSLAKDAENPDDILYRAGIKIDIGRSTNVNKNPQGESSIKILEKEIIRYDPSLRQISPSILVLITRQLNMRPLKSGFSPREIWLNRAWTNNSKLEIDDVKIADLLMQSRKVQNEHHQSHLANRGHKKPDEEQFNFGDLVFLRATPPKHKARDMYTVVEVIDKGAYIMIKKTETQFRALTVKVRPQEIIKVVTPSNDFNADQMSSDQEDERDSDMLEPTTATQSSEVREKDQPEIQGRAKRSAAEATRTTKRSAAKAAKTKIRDMKAMISRILSSDAKYSWVYFPSYDEQLDLALVIPSDLELANLPDLFAHDDDDPGNHHVELHEHVPPDTHDSPQPAPNGAQNLQNENRRTNYHHSSQARQRRTLSISRPISTSNSKARSSSVTTSSASKRIATSPRESLTKQSRMSSRAKPSVDYHDLEHRYDHL